MTPRSDTGTLRRPRAAPGVQEGRVDGQGGHDLDSIPLYVRGPYCILLSDEDARIRPYIVFDGAGAWLHDDTSLQAAREWVDRRFSIDLDTPLRSRRGRSRAR